jgi:hypothetical protein
MTEINNGGWAFPGVGQGVYWEGMTLRDYFAAAALQGMVASTVSSAVFPISIIAEMAYQYADAMLAQRDKGVK